jgi:hypothetical protein
MGGAKASAGGREEAGAEGSGAGGGSSAAAAATQRINDLFAIDDNVELDKANIVMLVGGQRWLTEH